MDLPVASPMYGYSQSSAYMVLCQRHALHRRFVHFTEVDELPAQFSIRTVASGLITFHSIVINECKPARNGIPCMDTITSGWRNGTPHSHSRIELQCTYVWVLHRSVSTVWGERGGGTLLGWATLAWFLPGLCLSWLCLA